MLYHNGTLYPYTRSSICRFWFAAGTTNTSNIYQQQQQLIGFIIILSHGQPILENGVLLSYLELMRLSGSSLMLWVSLQHRVGHGVHRDGLELLLLGRLNVHTSGWLGTFIDNVSWILLWIVDHTLRNSISCRCCLWATTYAGMRWSNSIFWCINSSSTTTSSSSIVHNIEPNYIIHGYI